MGTSMFDLVSAPEIAAYWTEKAQERAPYLGEELFPNQKQMGMELEWLIGQSGAPKALRPSGFDVKAIPRDRQGFEKALQDMIFFKESKYIDEKLRQELLKVMQTGNKMYIDTILNRIFNDSVELIDGASLRREIMRMQLLTTGKIKVSGNNQNYDIDYGIPDNHQGNAGTAWDDFEGSDPLSDLRLAIEKIQEDQGVTPVRAICNSATFQKLRQNQRINKTIFTLGDGRVQLNDNHVKGFLSNDLGIDTVVYNKLYTDDEGKTAKFIPDGKFILLPGTPLGSTWFGTTPEEADLMASATANVSVVDTGVAVTTTEQTDPVTVDTKVSMLSLPSFEAVNSVFILDTNASTTP